MNFVCIIRKLFKTQWLEGIFENGAWRLAKKVGEMEVDRMNRLRGSCKHQPMVAGNFTYLINGSAFTPGHFLQKLQLGFAYHQPHPLLRFVADDFFVGKGGIADRQFFKMNDSAGFFDQLREAVQMAARPVIVQGYDGIFLFFGHSPQSVIYPLLHLRIGALHGVEFDLVGKFAGSH